MGCTCSSPLAEEAALNSKLIDSNLKDEKRAIEGEHTIKILLLGPANSGKSTIMKQLKIIYNIPFTQEELSIYRAAITMDLLTRTRSLILGIDSCKIPYGLSATSQQSGSLPKQNKLGGSRPESKSASPPQDKPQMTIPPDPEPNVRKQELKRSMSIQSKSRRQSMVKSPTPPPDKPTSTSGSIYTPPAQLLTTEDLVVSQTPPDNKVDAQTTTVNSSLRRSGTQSGRGSNQSSTEPSIERVRSPLLNKPLATLQILEHDGETKHSESSTETQRDGRISVARSQSYSPNSSRDFVNQQIRKSSLANGQLQLRAQNSAALLGPADSSKQDIAPSLKRNASFKNSATSQVGQPMASEAEATLEVIDNSKSLKRRPSIQSQKRASLTGVVDQARRRRSSVISPMQSTTLNITSSSRRDSQAQEEVPVQAAANLVEPTISGIALKRRPSIQSRRTSFQDAIHQAGERRKSSGPNTNPSSLSRPPSTEPSPSINYKAPLEFNSDSDTSSVEKSVPEVGSGSVLKKPSSIKSPTQASIKEAAEIDQKRRRSSATQKPEATNDTTPTIQSVALKRTVSIQSKKASVTDVTQKAYIRRISIARGSDENMEAPNTGPLERKKTIQSRRASLASVTELAKIQRNASIKVTPATPGSIRSRASESAQHSTQPTLDPPDLPVRRASMCSRQSLASIKEHFPSPTFDTTVAVPQLDKSKFNATTNSFTTAVHLLTLEKTYTRFSERNVSADCVDAILTVCKDVDAVVGAGLKKQLIQCREYLVNNIRRIVAPEYIPTHDDILQSSVPTTGIHETKLKVDGVTVHLLDVGGQKSERLKWASHFDSVQAVFFVVDAGAFDETVEDDGTANQLLDAIKLFGTTMQHNAFKTVPIVLLVNKIDVLKEKLESKSIATVFQEFKGPQTFEDSIKFLISKFTSEAKRGEQVFAHAVQGTLRDSVSKVLPVTLDILRKSLKQGGSL